MNELIKKQQQLSQAAIAQLKGITPNAGEMISKMELTLQVESPDGNYDIHIVLP